MKFSEPISVNKIADKYNAKLIGENENIVYGLNEIHRDEEGDITFVDVEKYYEKSLNAKATVILIDKEVSCPSGKTLLVVNSPFQVFSELATGERQTHAANSAIHPTAKIHPTASIEPNVIIRENVTI